MLFTLGITNLENPSSYLRANFFSLLFFLSKSSLNEWPRIGLILQKNNWSFILQVLTSHYVTKFFSFCLECPSYSICLVNLSSFKTLRPHSPGSLPFPNFLDIVSQLLLSCKCFSGVCVCVCVCVCVLVTQSYPTLWDPMDCSPPGSSAQGILQVRVLEWVAISFSRGSCWSRDQSRSPALQADSFPSQPPGMPLSHLY